MWTHLQVFSSHVFKHLLASLAMRLHVGQKLLQRQESKLEVANERAAAAPPPASAPLPDFKSILVAILLYLHAIMPHLHNYIRYILHSHGQNELVATIGTITRAANVIILLL